jgi:hypothetical protein
MSSRHTSLAAVLSAVVLAAVGLWWLLPQGKGLVEETLSLQSRLLVGELTGPERRAAVVQVTRNIDKMSRQDVKTVRDALQADWGRLRKQAIDEYIAANAADRDALLDRDIGRLVAMGELVFAANPRATGQPPNRRGPKKAADAPGKGKAASIEKPADRYRVALVSRAKRRGVAVPEWLLGGAPR